MLCYAFLSNNNSSHYVCTHTHSHSNTQMHRYTEHEYTYIIHVCIVSAKRMSKTFYTQHSEDKEHKLIIL